MMENFIRFFNCPIPVTGCNLRCDYCYLVQQGNEKLLDFKETSDGFKYPVSYMLKALSPKRLGGICAFHICGEGETFLWKDICAFSKGLFEMGHYVSFTSNCTISKVVNELIAFPKEYREKMFVKCSFHYREFKKRGLLETFATNVKLFADAGISYTVEIVTNDYVLDELEDIKSFSIKHFGALPHVLTQRSELKKGQYPRMNSIMNSFQYDLTWRSFDSALFDYHQNEFDKKHSEYCYAGVYCLQFHLKNGDVFPCPGNTKKICNLFDDIEQSPSFVPVGHNCPFDNCWFAYVNHILGGVDRKLDSNVCFADFRDRSRSDNGNNWLSSTMRNAYSHRCSEYHEPLSDELALFYDAIMKRYYGKSENCEKDESVVNDLIKKAIIKKGYKTVVIYGLANVGIWLCDILSFMGVSVICGIDKRADKIKTDIEVITPDQKIPSSDAIIVTAFSSFHVIRNMLSEKTDDLIISILDLVNGN